MANEVPPQNSNDANKNKEHEKVCTLSFKLKNIYVSISTIYNEWFGIGNYTRIIPGGIYSLQILQPEWRKNNNLAFNNKLSFLQFIVPNIEKLSSSTGNPDALVLDALGEIIPQMKRSLFVINKFSKQLQKGGKLNVIVLDKSTQTYMVNDEVGVTNDVIKVLLRTHNNFV